jgi:hypothetical protein
MLSRGQKVRLLALVPLFCGVAYYAVVQFRGRMERSVFAGRGGFVLGLVGMAILDRIGRSLIEREGRTRRRSELRDARRE